MENNNYDELMGLNPLVDGFETNEPVQNAKLDDTEESDTTSKKDTESTEKTDTPPTEEDNSDASEFGDGSFASYGAPSSPYAYDADAPSGYYPGQPAGFRPNLGGASRGPYRNPYIAPPPPPDTPLTRTLKLIAWVLFGLTIVLMGASFILAITSAAHPEFNATATIFVFTLFPLVCLILGIIIRKNHQPAEAFIAIGIIGIAVCLLFALISTHDGSLSFSDDGNDGDGLIGAVSRAEEVMGMELPSYDSYSYSMNNYFTDSKLGLLELTFDGDDAEALIEGLERNQHFRTALPNPMIGMLHPYYRSDEADYVMIYNKSEDKYNSLPSVSGKYEMVTVFVYVDGDECHLEMHEYILSYRATFYSSI